MTKTPVRASEGVARPTQGGAGQGPDNTRPTPDAPAPQLCGDPGLSIQEAPPQRNPRDKMRGHRMVWRLLDSPLSPPASPQIQAPTPPGAGADEVGGTVLQPQPPSPEQRNPVTPGGPTHLAGDARPPARGVAVRRAVGAAGASGPVSEVEDPPLQRCPRTGIRPLPPSHRRLGLTVPASSRFLRAHPRLERSACPSSPAPLRAPPPRLTQRTNQTPCFCFEFSTPPKGAGHVTPRGGILRCCNGL